MLEVKQSASIWKFKQKLIENPSSKCFHLDVIFLQIQDNALMNCDGPSYWYEINFTSFGYIYV